MTNERNLTQTWIDVGLVTGVIAALAYFGPQLPVIRGKLHDFLFMAFGPLFSVFAVGLYHFFRRYRETVSNQIAHLFLFLAGVSFTYMATMQQSIFTTLRRYYQGAEEVDQKLWHSIFKGVTSTQLGLDFAFDIFVSVGTILLGLQLVYHPKFWKPFGVAGMLIGVTGLTFNFITFPENSGDHGLVDPGPFFGAWLMVVFIFVWRNRRWMQDGTDA